MAQNRLVRITGCLSAAGLVAALYGCGSGGGGGTRLVVNSLADAGPQTLRAAIAQAGPHDTITFDASLDGGKIVLTTTTTDHSTLPGETYSGMTFTGYQQRDYGRSALYAAKPLTIDASNLAHGITLKWGGDDSNRARVMAVYGDLTMKNVTIAGGHSSADAITGGTQPFTLARGGGLAVWGVARLDHCTIAGNRCTGDTVSSRDRGTYGGGIYANGLDLSNCVISGNSAIGYGAAGGGIYSVGGPESQSGKGLDTSLNACTVSANRVTAQHAYGAGIFTLSGGPNNVATMTLTNCTIARNLAEDNPNIADSGQFYYRGGGVYMGGGSLNVVSCTIAENEVNGHLAMFGGKANMGGGGIGATIGNAHVVEDLNIRQSIVVGNKMNGAAADSFAGSLINFTSGGYNLFGAMDFAQILAPVPDWMNLSRKHYPKTGDRDGIAIAQALDVAGARRSTSVTSVGTDSGQPAILSYPPASLAVDRIPTRPYSIPYVMAGYAGWGETTDDFLNHVISQICTAYGGPLGTDFGADLGDMTGTTWYGPRVTWPSDSRNAAWIAFWRSVDTEINGRLGVAGLNDEFWGSFRTGALSPNVLITVQNVNQSYSLVRTDGQGNPRPSGMMGDIGAIEQ